MTAVLALAATSSLCFGVALVVSRIGLRTLDARAGAAVSIPTATLLFVALAPFAIDLDSFNAQAALLFALVGVFYPTVVTLITFRSNERLGPTVTGALSGTAPLFALFAAALLLGEKIPARAAVACGVVAVAIAVVFWDRRLVRPGFSGWSLLWPLSGALLRGIAQAIAKAGLMLWPNPFAAGLIGYLISAATVIQANRYGRVAKPHRTRAGIAWFAATGVLNGGGVVLMYAALSLAPVSLVAPVVATYPLVTALTSALVLRDERLTMPMIAGTLVAVLAIVYLSRGSA